MNHSNYIIVCPCCNRMIEVNISESGEITTLLLLDKDNNKNIELGIVPFCIEKGGEKDE